MRFLYDELELSPLIPHTIYEGGTTKKSVADDPLTKLFRIKGFNKSIGNSGGFRKSNKEKHGKSLKSQIAYVVIYSSGSQKEWPNRLDKTNRVYTYYGDNKTPGNDLLNTKNKGNIFLKDIFKKAYESTNERMNIPPIFVFESTGLKRNVEFVGLAVPGVKSKSIKETLELVSRGEHDKTFQNYKAHFTLIDIEIEGISREWISELKNVNGDNYHKAPKEWINFVENGLDNTVIIKEEKIKYELSNIVYQNEKDYMQKTRLTQGRFREKLAINSAKCKICGLDDLNLLTASHIKPWKDSDDKEKLDYYNGLLLCPNHDALFDKGYISFDLNGKLLISKKLNKKIVELLQMKKYELINFDENHLKYIEWHRENVFAKID